MEISPQATEALQQLNTTMEKYPFGWVHTSVIEELQGANFITVDRTKTEGGGQYVAGQLTPEGTAYLEAPAAPEPVETPVVEKHPDYRGEVESPAPTPEKPARKKRTPKVKVEETVEEAPVPRPEPAPVTRANVSQGPAPAATTFKIDADGLRMLRGKTRGNRYPFDTLEVCELFFMPTTKDFPDIAKRLAAAARVATMRYASIKGTKQVVRRGKTVTVKDVDYSRKFAAAAVKRGEVYGEFHAPADGAVGIRLPVS